MKKNNSKLKIWEVLLLAFSLSVVVVAGYFLYVGAPLYTYILGMKNSDVAARAEKIGELGVSNGDVKRQGALGGEFKYSQKGEPLFNEDFITTGPQSSTTLVLNDGGVIELGPNTMVKLALESQLSFSGISRSAAVEVVSGNVSAAAQKTAVVLRSSRGQNVVVAANQKQEIKVAATPIVKPKPKVVAPVEMPVAPPVAPVPPVAAPVQPAPVQPPIVLAESSPSPSPSPSPSLSPVQAPPKKIVAKLIRPRVGEKVFVDPKNKEYNATLTVEATVNSDLIDAVIVIKKLKDKASEKIFEKTMKPVQSHLAVDFVLTDPGKYRVELLRADQIAWESSAKETQADFIVPSEIEMIDLLPVTIAGKSYEEAKAQGKLLKNFDLTFNWKKNAEAQKYHFKATDLANSKKTVIDKTVSENRLTISKGQIFTGAFTYQVSFELPRGFVAVSKIAEFRFSFDGPELTSPDQDAVIPVGATALLTWKKTNFTDAYEVQIFADQALTQLAAKKTVTENFYYFKNLKAGSYYWRVQSISGKQTSTFSKPRTFKVQ